MPVKLCIRAEALGIEAHKRRTLHDPFSHIIGAICRRIRYQRPRAYRAALPSSNARVKQSARLPYAILPQHGDAPRMTATIALVDDDRNILTSVSIALQAEGFLTRVYSDGEAALKALIENPPDLAVLDIKMPRMDGLELLRRLREKLTTPVIFLTSKDDELDEALGLAMGADDYIAKRTEERRVGKEGVST